MAVLDSNLQSDRIRPRRRYENGDFVTNRGFVVTDRDSSIETAADAGHRPWSASGHSAAPQRPDDAAQEPETAAQPAGGGYSYNPYAAQANALYEQLMNRGPFRYDLQGDMLYRQYADQYSQLGRMAMEDTMGKASALTGGYGNSYASQVGNNAYQGYLSQLNGMIPEFYDRAYQVWLNEGDELLKRYQLAQERAASHGGGAGGPAAAGDEMDYDALVAALMQSGALNGAGMAPATAAPSQPTTAAVQTDAGPVIPQASMLGASAGFQFNPYLAQILYGSTR